MSSKLKYPFVHFTDAVTNWLTVMKYVFHKSANFILKINSGIDGFFRNNVYCNMECKVHSICFTVAWVYFEQDILYLKSRLGIFFSSSEYELWEMWYYCYCVKTIQIKPQRFHNIYVRPSIIWWNQSLGCCIMYNKLSQTEHVSFICFV